MLGIQDYNKTNIVIYPNPSSNILNIKANSILTGIEVYTVLGQRVLKENPNSVKEASLDIAHLPAANYFVKVTTDGSSEVFQLIKE